MGDVHPLKGSGKSKHPLVHVLAGCSSGIAGAILLQPLDVVKTTMIGTFRSDSRHPIVFTRSIDAAKYVARSQGVFGLWRGLVPSVARVSFGAGMYFGILNLTLINNDNGTPTKQSAAFSGALARTISAIVASPLTLIKTRFEATALTSQEYKGVIDAGLKIAKNEGWKGLYSGLIPTLIRDVPYSSINVLIFTQVKPVILQYVAESHAASTILSGIISGSLGTAVTHPMDVVRTRMQLQQTNPGLLKALSRLFTEDGIRGLFKGVVPRLVKRGLSNAMTWTIYEEVVALHKRYNT